MTNFPPLTPTPPSAILLPTLNISIVIPSKNEEKNIGRLLKSIREQTRQPTDVIVADKSTDRTREIARSYGVMVVEGDGDGYIGKARNSGAAHATGDLLIFLDADVELPTVTFLEDAVTCFEACELDIASCYYHPMHSDRRGIITLSLMNIAKKIDSYLRKGISSGGACIVVRRHMFESFTGFSETMRVSEDLEFVRRVVKKGSRFGTLPLRVSISTRRFSGRSLGQVTATYIGGIGSILGDVLGISWFRKHIDTFDRWYGKTGGDGDVRDSASP